MPEEIKIDPDAAAETSREIVQICEDLGEYHKYARPYPDENLCRYHLDLIPASREVAQLTARWIVMELGHHPHDVDQHEHFSCGWCGEQSPSWRHLPHGENCFLREATQALLTLEALLPTETKEEG